MQDDKRHKRYEDLRSSVQRAVQYIRKDPEHPEQQEENAVLPEIFYFQSCQYGIKADQCKSHSIFVEQNIVKYRIGSEQFQQLQKTCIGAKPAVFQKYKSRGKQERCGHCRGKDSRGDITFQE